MMIHFPTVDGGEIPAYLALPAGGRGPGVVVLQEIFGLNDTMRTACDWLASQQFVAICPDLYWRVEPGIALSEPDVERARAIRYRVNDDQASDDAAAAMAFLRQHPACTGRVGVVGYCWGGLLAYLAGARHRPDAAVSYYGVAIETRLELAASLSCPLLLHYAELDKHSTPAVIEQVRAAFQGNPRVRIHEYPGCDHAFAREKSSRYNRAAAELANSRTLAWFRENLSGTP